MAQHDYNLADQSGQSFLDDINALMLAVATNNSGSTPPATTFAGMWWLDTRNDLLKLRNETNSGWITVAKRDGSGWTPYRQGTALGTAAVQDDTRYAHRSNNLSDLADAAAARDNLALGTAALMADSADTDLSNDPDAALRRDIGKAYVDAQIAGSAINLGSLSLGNSVAAHNLGAAPRDVSWYLECTTADAGFSIGDRIYHVSWQTDADAGEAFNLWADGTNVGFSLRGVIEIATKLGAFAALTRASWTVYAIPRV